MSAELQNAIIATARQLGIDPTDLATAMSYETAGTFDPWKRGPTTKWGTHRGLIQWGEPQAREYGVSRETPVKAQVEAAGRYLRDRGVRPGHGLLEIYSAINAGGVGEKYYGRTDAHVGGAPGSVRDKVANQMGGHRNNAERLLRGYVPGQTASQPASPPQAPGTPAPAFGSPVNIPDRPIGQPAVTAPVAPSAPAGEPSPMVAQMLGAMAMQPQGPQFSPVQIQGPSPQQAMALTEFIRALKNRAIA